MQPTTFREQFSDAEDACVLAQAIVDTVREPILVLDSRLQVIAAMGRSAVQGRDHED